MGKYISNRRNEEKRAAVGAQFIASAWGVDVTHRAQFIAPLQPAVITSAFLLIARI